MVVVTGGGPSVGDNSGCDGHWYDSKPSVGDGGGDNGHAWVSGDIVYNSMF